MRSLILWIFLFELIMGSEGVLGEVPTDTPPCSTNASNAYVDIVFVIDTSSNMGNANLQKVGANPRHFFQYSNNWNMRFSQYSNKRTFLF